MTPYYDEDGITIYHGDSADILPTLVDATVTACVTDPPYVIGAVSAGNLASKAGGWTDMMNSAGWFTSWYREVDRVLKRRGSFWTFCNWRSFPVVMRAAWWIGPGGAQGLRPSYELVALLAGPDFAIPDRGIPDIWQEQVGSYKPHDHPAEKPEALVRRILSVAAVPKSELVLDPFMGSGTCAEAAKILGLRFIGIEAEERWCEVAARRVSQGVLAL